ncbi:MAG: hypothetical protein DI628_00515 [Blastochloris viridis]|uniref:Competence protein n=1 Tax=Blastochloris viridis TaxID=1079 RepID=A0A6N4R1I6_BLAVI|nr:MAG: hypothetical protein DI628_00515 [Blastochloris viridis]
MANLKNPFGLKNGKVFHISEVERGRACGCVCPNCEKPLEAAKGSIKRHHFRHQHEYLECEGAFESAVHLAAKSLIAQKRQLKLPEYEIYEYLDEDEVYYDSNYEPFYGELLRLVKHGSPISFTFVDTEVSLDGIRPDLIGYVGKTRLAIEIAYRHPVSPEKADVFKRMNLSAIEINLSKLTQDDVQDWESLWAHICNSDNVKWIHNAKGEYEKARIRRELFHRRERDIERVKSLAVEYKRVSSPAVIQQLVQEGPQHPAWLHTRRYVPYALEDAPNFVNVQTTNGDWIYGCDRRVWQSAIFSYFIHKLGDDTRFSTEHVDSWLTGTVGLVVPDIVKALLRERKKNPSIIPEEVNDTLSSSWKALNEYFEVLCKEGYLVCKGYDSKHKGSRWYKVTLDR